jgi:hypothetical protein
VNPITTVLAAVVLLFVTPTGAFAQTADAGRALVASDNLKLSADTPRSGAEPKVVKRFIVPYAGVVRIRWQVRSDGIHKAYSFVTSQIDSCPIRTTTLDTFQSFACNLRVVGGDIVEVSAEGQQDPGYSNWHLRRVRLFFDVVNASGKGRTLPDENPFAAPEASNGAETDPLRSTAGNSSAAAMATAASAPTADVGRGLVLSDNLRLTMDTARMGAGPVTAKEFVVPYAGKIRVKLQVRTETPGRTAHGYVISQIDFCTSTTTLGTFESFTCDLRVVEGDLVKVVVDGELSPTTSFGTVRRVRVFYDVIDAAGRARVLLD